MSSGCCFLKLSPHSEGIRQSVKVIGVAVKPSKIQDNDMGFCVFIWIIPFHPLPLGCVDKTMCSNDGTLTFEVPPAFYPQNNHSHFICIMCITPNGIFGC